MREVKDACLRSCNKICYDDNCYWKCAESCYEGDLELRHFKLN